MSKIAIFAASAALVLALGSAAFADEWVAVKLRGGVFEFVDGGWVQLRRGDVVSDQQVIRSQPNGFAQFKRGAETVQLGPNTQIQIIDRDGEQFTTVKQWYGEVAIEAEVQDVQHFAVRTPYIAAVVKGTRFVVDSDEHGSEVSVQRGHVAVEDSHTRNSVTIAAGQSASTGNGQMMAVEGSGNLPVVVDPSGRPVDAVHGSNKGDGSLGGTSAKGDSDQSDEGKGKKHDEPPSSGRSNDSGNAGGGTGGNPGSGGNGNGNGGGGGNSASDNSGGNGKGGGSEEGKKDK